MLAGIVDVVFRSLLQERKLLTPERPLDAARKTQDERSRRNPHPFGDERTGPDEAFVADDAAVEKNRTHADQAIIPHARAMHDRAMSDCDTLPKDNGNLARGVQDRAV